MMACLQLLKSTPSDSQAKSRCLCSSFSSMASRQRSARLQKSGMIAGCRRFRISCDADDRDKQNNGEEPPESLFMRELRRRGMTPTSLLEEKSRGIERDEEIKFREGDGDSSYSSRNGVANDDEVNISGQREKSMALNSEGLEVLIPRAKLLLTLGGTFFFLAFWPLILVTVAFFSALYLYFGPEFVHDGSETPITPPQYVDPYELLEEDRIYKTAPLLN
ncbi:Unknown protein [Striga hermonthica]|uniref:Tubulin alpha-6 chain n=1 Tax=Striga hermonthica TaxID=68872 RepID=A0A9N7MVW1_STRHE|nr:Unknown protein [Striga hermonthica]